MALAACQRRPGCGVMHLDLLDISEAPSQIICYPRPSEEERTARIEEMRRLGVEGLLLEGEKVVDGYKVLGKGCVSVAVLVKSSLGTVVLKIRRVDANRGDMFHEVEMLSFANGFGIGPKLLAHSRNLLLLEYIDGPTLVDWLHKTQESDLERAKSTLGMLLRQCYTLDQIHLDHGELSNASKHVIIRRSDWRPSIIDFESASNTRHVKNLTSICQFLFMSATSLNIFRIWKRLTPIEDLKNRLREYKSGPSEEKFRRVLATLNLP